MKRASLPDTGIPLFGLRRDRRPVFPAHLRRDYPGAAIGARPHTFSVRATDPSGNADSTPASDDFTVEKKRKQRLLDVTGAQQRRAGGEGGTDPGEHREHRDGGGQKLETLEADVLGRDPE
jgi:hypothetical protein